MTMTSMTMTSPLPPVRSRTALWIAAAVLTAVAGRRGQPRPSDLLAPRNDNDARGPSYPKRMPRRGLVCRWRVQPLTGALECMWQTDMRQTDVRQTDMQQAKKVGDLTGATDEAGVMSTMDCSQAAAIVPSCVLPAASSYHVAAPTPQ